MWLKNQDTILQLKNILDEDNYKIGNFVNICKVEFLDFDGNIIEAVSLKTFKKYFDEYIEYYSNQEVCEITFTEFKLLQIRFFLQLAYEDVLPLRGEVNE